MPNETYGPWGNMRKMPLDEALLVLAREHTQDDEGVGFLVNGLRNHHGGSDDYVTAWKTVREHLGMPVSHADFEKKDV